MQNNIQDMSAVELKWISDRSRTVSNLGEVPVSHLCTEPLNDLVHHITLCAIRSQTHLQDVANFTWAYKLRINSTQLIQISSSHRNTDTVSIGAFESCRAVELSGVNLTERERERGRVRERDAWDADDWSSQRGCYRSGLLMLLLTVW